MSEQWILLDKAAQVLGPYTPRQGRKGQNISDAEFPLHPFGGARTRLVEAISTGKLRCGRSLFAEGVSLPDTTSELITVIRSEVESWAIEPELEELDRSHAPVWTLPMVLAWLTTNSFAEVKAMGAGLAWPLMPGPTLKTFEDVAEEAALGRLLHRVAVKHCRCGSVTTEVNEKWEICRCVDDGLRHVKARVAAGSLKAILHMDSRPQVVENIDDIYLDQRHFRLESIFPIGAFSFNDRDVLALRFRPGADQPNRAIRRRPAPRAKIMEHLNSIDPAQRLKRGIEDLRVECCAAFPEYSITHRAFRGALAEFGEPRSRGRKKFDK